MQEKGVLRVDMSASHPGAPGVPTACLRLPSGVRRAPTGCGLLCPSFFKHSSKDHHHLRELSPPRESLWGWVSLS